MRPIEKKSTRSCLTNALFYHLTSTRFFDPAWCLRDVWCCNSDVSGIKLNVRSHALTQFLPQTGLGLEGNVKSPPTWTLQCRRGSWGSPSPDGCARPSACGSKPSRTPSLWCGPSHGWSTARPAEKQMRCHQMLFRWLPNIRHVFNITGTHLLNRLLSHWNVFGSVTTLYINHLIVTFSMSMRVTGIFRPTRTITVLPHISTPRTHRGEGQTHTFFS